MSKEQEFLEAVKSQNVGAINKFLQKMKKSKSLLLVSTVKQRPRLNINIQDINGLSALHITASRGHLRLVQSLLDSGSNVSLVDRSSRTPLHFASAGGHTDVVRTLLKYGADAIAEDIKGECPIHAACRLGHLEVVKTLIPYHQNKSSTEYQNSLMTLARKYGHESVAQFLSTCGPAPPRISTQKTSYRHHLPSSQSANGIHRLRKQDELLTRSGPESLLEMRSSQSGCHHLSDTSLSQSQCDCRPVMEGMRDHLFSRSLDAGDLLGSASRDSTPVRSVDGLDGAVESAPDSLTTSEIVPSTPTSQDNQTDFSISEQFTTDPNTTIVRTPQSSDAMWHEHASSTVPSNASCITASIPSSPDPLPPPPTTLPAHLMMQQERIIVYPADISRTGSYSNPHNSSVQRKDEVSIPTSPNIPTPAVYNSSNRSSSTSVDSGRGSVNIGSTEGSKQYQTPGVQPGGQPSNTPVTSVSSNVPNSTSGGQSRHQGHLRASLDSVGHDSRSSSSSSSSLDHLEESQVSTPGGESGGGGGGTAAPPLNIVQLKARGVPESEIIKFWLSELQLSGYSNCFLQAGYDMSTMMRMTPEDLNAIGVTNPHHRKIIKTELSRLVVPDGLPDFIPSNILEWLELIGMPEYGPFLIRQSITSFPRLVQISWDDLDDLGIQRLGHQKKMMLAVERLARLVRSSTTSSSGSGPSTPVHTVNSSTTSSSPNNNVVIHKHHPSNSPQTPNRIQHFNYPNIGPKLSQDMSQSSGSRIPRPNMAPSNGAQDSIHQQKPMYSQQPSHSIYTDPAQSRHSRSASLGPPQVPVPAPRPIGRVTATSLERRRQPPPTPPKRVTSIRPESSSPTVTRKISPSTQPHLYQQHYQQPNNPSSSSRSSHLRNAYENCPEIVPPSGSQSVEPRSSSAKQRICYTGSNGLERIQENASSVHPHQYPGQSSQHAAVSQALTRSNSNSLTRGGKPVQYVAPQQQPHHPYQTYQSAGSANSSPRMTQRGNKSINYSTSALCKAVDPPTIPQQSLDSIKRKETSPPNQLLNLNFSKPGEMSSSADATKLPSVSSATTPSTPASVYNRSRSSSLHSMESVTSIPFANENCSTIKHRSPPARPGLSTLGFFEEGMAGWAPAKSMGDNGNHKAVSADSDLSQSMANSTGHISQIEALESGVRSSTDFSVSMPTGGLKKSLPLHLPYDVESRKRNPPTDLKQRMLIRPPPIPTRRESMSNAQAQAEERVRLPTLEADTCSNCGEFEDLCGMLEDLTGMLEMTNYQKDADKTPTSNKSSHNVLESSS